MSLRRRWLIALGALCCLTILCTIQAQEATQGDRNDNKTPEPSSGGTDNKSQ